VCVIFNTPAKEVAEYPQMMVGGRSAGWQRSPRKTGYEKHFQRLIGSPSLSREQGGRNYRTLPVDNERSPSPLHPYTVTLWQHPSAGDPVLSSPFLPHG